MTSGQETRAVLHIDWTRCDGRGFCAELLAGRLTRDQWGYPLAVGARPNERTSVPISNEELEAAEDAVDLCPRMALTLRHFREAAADYDPKSLLPEGDDCQGLS